MTTDHFTELDHHYMRRALELAHKGWGFTNPNPLVGCVVVKEGRVLAEGWHARYGADHAEAMALKQLESAEGATLYVNLEPCNHTGKTPPCSELILHKRVSRVVYALDDPNPVAVGGAARLRSAGVRVEGGLLREEAAQLNEIFVKWVTRHQPFVMLKYAMTLDGRIAAATGDSRWITGPEARGRVHGLRQRAGGILAGSGTVLADDPELSVRDWAGDKRQPLRVILDARGRIPLAAKVFQDQQIQQTLLVTTDRIGREKAERLIHKGVQIWQGPLKAHHLDLEAVLNHLKAIGCDSVLVEGGAAVHGSFLDSRLVDRIYAFIAPKLIGGSAAPGPVGGKGLQRMAEAIELKACKTEQLGRDILITGTPKFPEEADYVHGTG